MTLGNSNISIRDITLEQLGSLTVQHTFHELSNIAGFWSPSSSNVVPPYKLSYFKGYSHLTSTIGRAADSTAKDPSGYAPDLIIPLGNSKAATVFINGVFTSFTNGILYESGGIIGLILYIYNKRIYGQAGDGTGSFGQDSTFECSYLIPNGITINEIIFTANTDTNQSNLYVNGYNNPSIFTSSNMGAMSNVSTSVIKLCGTGAAGWGRSYTGLSMNRANWPNLDNQGGLVNGTILRSHIWNSYMQVPAPPPP